MQLNTTSKVYKHDVFISYSRKNESFAAKLEQALESYRPPKGLNVTQRYLEVFRDKEDFTAGEYHQNLDKHLREASKLIVICSPAARESKYVNDEIQRFARVRGAEHIIPILFSGIPNNEAKPEQKEDMAFPEALCEVMEMPLAINYLGFEAHKDKLYKGIYSDAWHSMLANIYDISRSEVEQREKKRRARTRRITYSVLSGSVAVLSILLIFALFSRSQAVAARIDADKQRGAAVTAREAEEKERKRAEEQEQVAKNERDAAVEAKRQTQEALDRETIAKEQAEERRVEAERQRQIAQEQTLIAEERARLAMARQLAVQAIAASEETTATTALGTVGKERSVLLALESYKRFQTPEGAKALRDAIARLTGNPPEIKFKEEDSPSDFSLSPDGKSLAIIQGAKAYLRNASAEQGAVWIVPADNPHSAMFSSDGTRLATFSNESTLIWDVSTRKQIGRLPSFPLSNNDDFFTRSGKAVINFNGSQLIAVRRTGLEVWDVSSSSVVRRIAPPQDGWGKAALSPDGKWLATQDSRDLIRVIDVTTGRQIGSPRGDKVTDLLALSKDGNLLATTNDSEVYVWQVKGWRKIARLPHERNLMEMAFSSDGHWLTTVTPRMSMDAGEMDSTSFPGSAIRVWNLKTQSPVMHVSLAQEGGLYGVVFSANGDMLVASSPIIKPSADIDGSIEYDGTRLLLWSLLPADLTKTACSLLTRNLSKSEWQTFMGTEPYRFTCQGLPTPEE